MKPLRYLSVLLLAIGMTFTSARASNNVTMQVTNNTPYTMTEFYASGSDVSSWSTTNLIAGQSLAPGQSMTINVGSADNCTFDVMAVLYGASQYAYQYSVNPCQGQGWTITQGQ